MPRFEPSLWGWPLVQIAYFVHDLADANVAKRVRMLRQSGAEVGLAGFRRGPSAPRRVIGAPAVDLGRTRDGRLKARALRVALQVLRAPFMAEPIRGSQVVVARSLEMLTIAWVARSLHARRARLVYECLDVHRLLVSRGLVGFLLRRLESALLSRANLLIVSSPAFLTAYFEPRHKISRRKRLAVLVAENKVFESCRPRPSAEPRRPGPPWRIGWFGMLRCRKSFELLSAFARERAGLIEVIVAGRPSEKEFPDFAREASRARGVTFAGAYGPEALERLYQSVHFNWAIDYFEEGLNSAWLLPNRIYEGGGYGAVPIALASTETGRWLAARGLGLLVEDPARDLDRFFASLDAQAYLVLEARSRTAPSAWFSAGDEDCKALLQALEGAVPEEVAG
ncbi:MAG: glycosyl transferase family 1 [Caulobacteraceae bacterium]